MSRRARTAIAGVSGPHELGIAAISLKEAAWHLARGRIVIDSKFGAWPLWLRTAAASSRLEVVPLTADVAIESEQLGNDFPADPADRLIAATARVHGLTLVTADERIRKSGAVRTLW